MSGVWRNLCRKGEHWYLLSWDENQRAGTLVVGPAMPRETGFAADSGPFHFKRVDWTHDINLYPEVRYRGYRVYPQGWHLESSEPLVKCILDQSTVSFGGWEETQKTIASLIEDGWQWSAHQGGIKYIHVDDLEKIEGPPPAGAF